MKNVGCVLALCASTAFAQYGNRVSLQLGAATVWLGMDRAVVAQRIKSSGMYFPDKSDSDGQVIVVDFQTKRLYTLEFEGNKLVYADRNWLHDSDGLPSVMDALTSLVDQGATKCTIEHAPMSSPDVKMNRVFIDCGARGILLTYGSTNAMTDNSILERIGHTFANDAK